MKKLMFALVALALALPMTAGAQNSTKQNDQTRQNDRSRQTDQSKAGANANMSGTVSKDDKSFTNDKDNKTYTVDNPDALQVTRGSVWG